MKVPSLVQTVREFHEKEGRHHLPWRKTKNPYYILVSEYMLQQTQVERVLPKYRAFIKEFPTLQALARASLPSVLRAWQGLGYNRRGKFLYDAARVVVATYNGKIPRDPDDLATLPGVGPYTARAIATFAFNRPEVFIETNIRTVFMHTYFKGTKKVSDIQLLPYIVQSVTVAGKSGMTPRAWYGALMDYGAYLKKRGVRINRKSLNYRTQPSFKNSTRQLRGAIVRELLLSPRTLIKLAHTTARDTKEITRELKRLCAEGLVVSRGRFFSISDSSAS